MDAKEIETYLAELGAELKSRGVVKPIRLMLIGGAYMLVLERASRTTEDIDIFWLEGDAFQHMRASAWCRSRGDIDCGPTGSIILARYSCKTRLSSLKANSGNGTVPSISILRQRNTCSHSRSWPDETKTLQIVLYYSHRQTLQHANRPDN
jgi:hypothetical protein